MSEADAATQSETILRAEAERVRGLLRRYLSPRVAEAVLEEVHAVQGQGEELDVSVLFCDLRGFTKFAERTPSAQVARILNEYLDEMTQVVFKYDGMLDKYTGDGLLAVFGVPYPEARHAERAVHAALEMQARYHLLLQRWDAAGWIGLPMGIGVESGTALAGNFGSAHRVDYTVIGHPVNVAARLTAIAPAHQILLGNRAREQVENLAETVPLGSISLKNVAAPVPVCRLIGVRVAAAVICLACGGNNPTGGTCPECGMEQGAVHSAAETDGLLTVASAAATFTSLAQMGSPHLIAVAGPHQGSDFRLAFPCAIGREALTNQIVLSLDPAVSRRHAVIRRENGKIVIADLASQNGTLVNDEPVDVTVIDDGDVISIGRTRLVVSELRSSGLPG